MRLPETRASELEHVKRIKILEKFFLAWTKSRGIKRVVMGPMKLGRGIDAHTTWTYTDDGYVEIHGSGKIRGRRTVSIPVGKIRQEEVLEIFWNEADRCVQQIDIHDIKNKDHVVLLLKSGKDGTTTLDALAISRKEASLNEQSLEKFESLLAEDFDIVKLPEIEKYDFDCAFLSTPILKELVGILFKYANNYFVLFSKDFDKVGKNVVTEIRQRSKKSLQG